MAGLKVAEGIASKTHDCRRGIWRWGPFRCICGLHTEAHSWMPASRFLAIEQEQVEELVFVEPHQPFYQRVMSTPPRALQVSYAVLTLEPYCHSVGRPSFERLVCSHCCLG